MIDFTQPLEKVEPGSLIGIVATTPFDMEAVKERFAPYLIRIQEMKGLAEAHQVSDDASAQQATAMAGETKRLGKKLEEGRKEVIEDPSRFVKSVNGLIKGFTDPLNTIESGLKTKIGQYQYKVELERREAERKAQEEVRKLQAKLDAQAKKTGIAPIQVQAPVVVPQKTVARSDNGSAAHIRRVWKAEIVDAQAVPREFCSPDMRLINEAVKAGIREVPGLRIFEDIQTILRT